jgi:choline oxidase
MHMGMEFDYVVVGGGAAGAVAARRLAELSSARIALLEAGPDVAGRDEVRDFRRFNEVKNSTLARMLPILQPRNGNGRFRYPIARMLGGSTSQNTCIWFRPPASDFAAWTEAGAAGWGPQVVWPHFEALESRINIETVQPTGPAHEALAAAAQEMGVPTVDFSQPFAEGWGSYRMSKRGVARESTAEVFLSPKSAPPPNLSIFTETPVSQLMFSADRHVSGVLTPRGAISARKEVILSCGALDTPRVLMLSGIGPAEELQALGIAPRHDLPQVGRHLLDHPAACINAASSRAIDRDPLWNYSGVLFAKVEAPDAQWPDIELQLGPELFEQQTAPSGYPSAPHGFTVYMTVNRARSEGSVRLRSREPEAEALIDAGYFTDQDGYDLRVMIEGIRFARRLFASSALSSWIDHELAPGPSLSSGDELASYVRETTTTGYHPAGTCKMGKANDLHAVVDPSLRVRGIGGLRIADASIMPTMVSVNIAATCMMIGHRAAQLVADDRESSSKKVLVQNV